MGLEKKQSQDKPESEREAAYLGGPGRAGGRSGFEGLLAGAAGLEGFPGRPGGIDMGLRLFG